MPGIKRAAAPVFGPLATASTYRRWVYLILGGALFVPFALIGFFLVPTAVPDSRPDNPWFWLVLLTGMFGVMVAIAFVPAVRVVEVTAVRELLTARVPAEVSTRGMIWPVRWRCALWFVTHLLTGAVISIVTLIVPAVIVLSLAVPFTGSMDVLGLVLRFPQGWASGWVPLAGLAVFVLLVHLVLLTAAALARLAPELLGPTAAEQLRALARRNDELAERNRLARELHDSVGHALSVVTIQAGAARRVLANDPDFVDRALTAIEESARSALEDLDHVLGLLREDRRGDDKAPTRTLTDLPQLIERAGVPVKSIMEGDIAAVPPAVSREAYRIVQECLTNVLRHAGKVPVTLVLRVRDGTLELVVRNASRSAAETGRRSGGRGLAGMRERVGVLGGMMVSGEDGDGWQVRVRIPLGTGTVRA